jgi:1-acyl-sn-glycerol-3-phosphate acyltransferase
LSLLQREKKICLGVDPFWSRLAMIATQDIALNNFFWRKIVISAENLPLNGPVILAPTHRSRWDALMLTMAAGRRVTKRDCRYMVTRSEMTGLQGWFLNRLGCFPIDQGKPSLTSLRFAVDLLISRQQLVVFPEGRINRTGEPVKLKKGLIRLAQLASNKGLEIKIVPVGLAYSEVIPKFRGSASICFSKPIIISKDCNQSTNDFNINLYKSMRSAEQSALLAIGRR